MGYNPQNIGVCTKYKSLIQKRPLFTESDRWRSIGDKDTKYQGAHDYIKHCLLHFFPAYRTWLHCIVWSYTTSHNKIRSTTYGVTPTSFSQNCYAQHNRSIILQSSKQEKHCSPYTSNILQPYWKKAHLSIYNTDNEADWLNKAFLADRNIKNNLFPLP